MWSGVLFEMADLGFIIAFVCVQANNREVRWVRGPGRNRTPVNPVQTESDGPQKRLGES